jgi:hypothetical protein
MRLLIQGEFDGIMSPEVSFGRCVYSSVEFTGIRSPEVSYGRCVYSSMESLLVSGVQEFHMQEAFTHPWRVYWYQESRSSNKEALTMESLLVSGAQKFHMEDAFTHPWNLLILRYESLNYLGKECLITPGRLLDVLTSLEEIKHRVLI